MPEFKSNDRPSDTKSVVLNRERDARLLAHVNTTKGESAFWRAAGNFYLDFMAWLAAQPDAPEPGQTFLYYQKFLELRSPASLAPIDPESIAAAVLPGVRDIIEAALAGYRPLPQEEGEDSFDLELADLFAGELVLE